jgi:hypothetical protein
MIRIRFLVSAMICIASSGCSLGGSAIIDTFKSVVPLPGDQQVAELDSRFQYLRVDAGGRVGYLALGATEPSDGTPTEVWYSANREVIKLSSGHIAAAIGTTEEWRKASLPRFQSWQSIANSNGFRWTRYRDVMPGYRYGIVDTLFIRAIPRPPKSNWEGGGAERLMWFEESQEASSAEPLPIVRYAVQIQGGFERVEYGEACLSPTLCFSWQRWNAAVKPESSDK